METTIISPVGQNKRIVIVDVLRGWALLGVVLMNYTAIFFSRASSLTPTLSIVFYSDLMVLFLILNRGQCLAYYLATVLPF